jgi:hypothetical protein
LARMLGLHSLAATGRSAALCNCVQLLCASAAGCCD